MEYQSCTRDPFDASLYLPPKSEGEIDSKTDIAKVNLPKIFRRQVQYEVSKAAGITDQTSWEIIWKLKRKICVILLSFLIKEKSQRKKCLIKMGK